MSYNFYHSFKYPDQIFSKVVIHYSQKSVVQHNYLVQPFLFRRESQLFEDDNPLENFSYNLKD